MQQIAVIDYGMGNLRSVAKAIEAVATDAEVIVTSSVDVIDRADKIVCPGQGAAADCMAALHRGQHVPVINQSIGSKPFLGICMGLQVLLTRSEENNGTECIDAISGDVKRFARPLLEQGSRLKVPHMGWSEVMQLADHPLWHGIENNSRFYFAHSYYCKPNNDAVVVGRCKYGLDFAVAVAQRNLFACQFHPEKSAKDGLQLLKNFVRWDGEP